MGRLENFIPSLKKFKLSKKNHKCLMDFDQGKRFSIDSSLTPFIKQINGHASLKEIFQSLNTKGESFSIEKSLDTLSVFATEELLNNHTDFFKLLRGQGGRPLKSFQTKDIERSYFSNERLISLIQKTTLFLECDRKIAMHLLQHSTLERLEPQTPLIKQGSKSSTFFVLLTGEVGVYREGQCLANLGPLSVFGESAAIFDQTRNADVTTTETSWLLHINASKIVNTKTPESFEAFKGLKSRLVLNHTLGSNPLFRNVPTDIMQLFISKCRLEKYSREQTVIEQDETSGNFYFILRGSVSVIKDGMPITSLSEGDHFGEIAAIFNEPRTASVITETNSTFLVLNQKSLFDVLSSHFRLAIDIEKKAQERRSSSDTIFKLLDDSAFDENEAALDEFTDSGLFINDEFLEISHSNFDLEVIDFSEEGKDEAS